jgi:N-acetylglucosamine-6-sulfatase
VIGRGVAALGAAGVIALGAGTSQSAAGPANEPRPNVIVVMTDDQTQASASLMPGVQSELAAEGTTFANSFTNWPLCCPSRATFYTGQYAHNHGVLGNSPPDGGFVNLADANTLPVWLRQAGYRTIHIGKYLNGYGQDGNDPTYVPPGWDEWNAASAGTTQSVYDYVINRNGSLVNYGATEAEFKQDVFSDLAVDAINRNTPGGPFFMGLMYTAPHGGGPNPNPHPPTNCQNSAKPAPRHATAFDSEPLPQPPSFNEADVSDKPAAVQSLESITPDRFTVAQRRYRCRLESLLSVDDGVRRVVEALEAAGELDNTLIVFTSDNGFFHGEHRVQTGKNRVYEEAQRVPLLMRGPGVPEGVTVEELAINADLAPTVVDAADATAGLTVDGRSLLPAAEHPDRLRGRELLFEKGDVVDADDDDTPQSGTYAAVRTARYAYVENLTGEVELYDLETDPYQLQNQAANPAYDAVEAALAARLASLRSCAGPSCQIKPDLKLKLPKSVRQNGRSCREARDFLARVRGSVAGQVVHASFAVGTAAAGEDSVAPYKRVLKPSLLRAKRKPEIRVVAELLDGRALSMQKRVRICR